MIGKLIVFEGVNGSGKSTIIDKLCTYYKSHNQPVCVYKFPDRTTKYGKLLDSFLTNKLDVYSKYDLLDLFAKNRAEFKERIIADIVNGNIVICDRYYYSGIAYQIPEQITNPSSIKIYTELLLYFDNNMPLPDLVLLIDGDYLSNRNDSIKQRYHYNSDRVKLLYDKFKLVLYYSNVNHYIIHNKYNTLSETIKTVVKKIDNCYDIK
jgi:dTMP kinase